MNLLRRLQAKNDAEEPNGATEQPSDAWEEPVEEIIEEEAEPTSPVSRSDRMRKLPFSWFFMTGGGRGVAVAIATMIAAVVFFRPDWLGTPFRVLGEAILEAFGVGAVPFLLWVAVFLLLFYYRLGTLFRRWRLVLGTAALVVASQGALAYFSGPLLWLDEANWGGDFGRLVHGDVPYQSYIRVSLIAAVGIWILAPHRSLFLVRVTSKTVAWVVTGIPHGFGLIRGRDDDSDTVVEERPAQQEKPSKPKRSARQSKPQPKQPGESTSGDAQLDGEEMVSELDRLFAIERLKEEGTRQQERALEKEWEAANPQPLPPPPVPRRDPPPKAAMPLEEQAPPPRVVQEPVASSEHQWNDEPALTSEARDMLEDIQGIQDAVWEEVAEASPNTADDEPAVVAELEDELDDAPAVMVDEPPPPAKRLHAAAPKPKAEAPTPKPAPMQGRLPWVLPSAADIFSPGQPPRNDQEELNTTARLIESTMGQHGVEVNVAEIRPGPSVTMFGLVPGWRRRGRGQEENQQRVRVDSILQREKDLALALAAPSLRIEAPVPGESVVGVEVPNQTPSVVSIRSVMESTAYNETLQRGGLSVALGQGSVGEAMALDLLRMPHLLIAGATGSGKSVCIHSIIGSIITHQQPSDVRLVLVDPKRVELTPYNGIPHLATPVVVEVDKTVRLLKAAVQEMLRRYQLLEEIGVRNIQSYNRSTRAKEPIPYLVICIDELADLMMASSYEIERNICRLAQLGRATGIHLVVATQRPSVDVVTGLIKANFPSRISFAVASQIDSRTILDTGGAERLLGRGDMLFVPAEAAKPRRVQGAYITEEETEVLADYWRNQQGPPLPEIPLEAYIREAEEAEAAVYDSDGDFSNGPQDALFQKAADMASRYNQLSTSLLQRRLRIGYPRAARLMDELEDAGIVGAGEPGKPREVLYRRDDIEEEP